MSTATAPGGPTASFRLIPINPMRGRALAQPPAEVSIADQLPAIRYFTAGYALVDDDLWSKLLCDVPRSRASRPRKAPFPKTSDRAAWELTLLSNTLKSAHILCRDCLRRHACGLTGLWSLIRDPLQGFVDPGSPKHAQALAVPFSPASDFWDRKDESLISIDESFATPSLSRRWRALARDGAVASDQRHAVPGGSPERLADCVDWHCHLCGRCNRAASYAPRIPLYFATPYLTTFLLCRLASITPPPLSHISFDGLRYNAQWSRGEQLGGPPPRSTGDTPKRRADETFNPTEAI